MTSPPRIARSHQKFVAFSVVGVAMVCLPLLQVLNYQQAELEQLQNQRAQLDPVAAAVNAQWALLDHRALASAVLTGQGSMESDRQRAKTEVDDRLLSLSSVLGNGQWQLAVLEARALGEDWSQLAQEVQAQTLSPAQSNEAHTLRIEQTLQIVDLVTTSLAPDAELETEAPSAFLNSALQLSQVAAHLSQYSPQALEAALTRAIGKPTAQALQAPLAQAVQASQQFQKVWARAKAEAPADHHSPGAGDVEATLIASEVQQSLQQALVQQRRLLSALKAHHDHALGQQTATVQAQRDLLLACLLVLGLFATGLGLSLLRPIMRSDARALSSASDIGLWVGPAAQARADFEDSLDEIDSDTDGEIGTAFDLADSQAPGAQPASSQRSQAQGLLDRLRDRKRSSPSDSLAD